MSKLIDGIFERLARAQSLRNEAISLETKVREMAEPLSSGEIYAVSGNRGVVWIGVDYKVIYKRFASVPRRQKYQHL